MKPSKDYDYYMEHDPCVICVCGNNQGVDSEEPYPCSVCYNYSEFIPEGGDGPVESDWLNNVWDYQEVLDIMDEIVTKIHLLDEKIPDASIDRHADELLSYIQALKASSAEAWMFDPRDMGGPCFDGDSLVDCEECSRFTCPYRKKGDT